MDEKLTERVPILMSPSDIVAIDEWRWLNRAKSRGEAIRLLVVHGLRSMLPSAGAALPQTLDPNQAPAPGADAPQVVGPRPGSPPAPLGPFLWVGMDDTATEKLNTDIPKRVRVQLEWLRRQQEAAGQKRPPIGKVVSAALREYTARELRARGVPP